MSARQTRQIHENLRRVFGGVFLPLVVLLSTLTTLKALASPQCRDAFQMPRLDLKFEPRVADNSDAPRVISFISDRRTEMGLNPRFGADGRPTLDDLVQLEDLYGGPAGKLFLLLNEGQVVATAAYHRTGPFSCELKKIYVDPKIRKQGLGRKIVELAMTTARTEGYRIITLQTRPEMIDAIALYQKLGFTKDSDSTDSVYHFTLRLPDASH